jgi:hypothetical protein
MARKIRIEYAGAAFHVMARGNQGRERYDDDYDRKLWLETLGEAGAHGGNPGLRAWAAESILRP